MKEENIQKYLQMLGYALQERQVRGENLVADSVVMLLDIKQPEKCKDMDAYLDYLRGDGPAIERRKDIDTYFAGDDTVILKVTTEFKMRNIYGGDQMFNHLPKQGNK